LGVTKTRPLDILSGAEGVASVKEKLKTVSEELEYFVDASVAADIQKPGHSHGRMDATAGDDDRVI
jgi:hypothetical protein